MALGMHCVLSLLSVPIGQGQGTVVMLLFVSLA
jgi:hypothetical protein